MKIRNERDAMFYAERMKHYQRFYEPVKKLKEEGFTMKEISIKLDIAMHTVSYLFKKIDKEVNDQLNEDEG